MNKKFGYLTVLLTLVLSVVFALFFPSNVTKGEILYGVNLDETTIIPQTIEGVNFQANIVTKLYVKGKLVGVVNDASAFNKAIEEIYNKYYSNDYDVSQLSLNDDVLTISEKTFWIYENKDEQIKKYIVDNDLVGIQAVKIEITNITGETESIVVKSEDDFSRALKRFALNFISEETFIKLENKEEIPELNTYGSQDVKIYLEDTIVATPTKASVEDIYLTEQDIYDFLCFGKDYDLEYYTVEPYDTVFTIALKKGLTPEEIVMVNSELHEEEQALVPGTQLVVSKLSSPVNVVVETKVCFKEITTALDKYIKDDTLFPDEVEQVVEGHDGYNDVYVSQIYVNGQLSAYRNDHIEEIIRPVASEYKVGTKGLWDTGTLDFGFPIHYPEINQFWWEGHAGVDFISRPGLYDGLVIASETGTIIDWSYDDEGGWHYTIDHGIDNNGNHWYSYYGHMAVGGNWYPVGTFVVKGQAIGDIGQTGLAYGLHIHFNIIRNGKWWDKRAWTDPCTVMDCKPAVKSSWLIYFYRLYGY